MFHGFLLFDETTCCRTCGYSLIVAGLVGIHLGLKIFTLGSVTCWWNVLLEEEIVGDIEQRYGSRQFVDSTY
jgi:hypothetical protein